MSLALKYNQQGNFNCAESLLLACSELYGFEVSPEELHQVSAFGGGMGCGSTCGVITGAAAVLGRLAVRDKAHTTAGFRPLCGSLVAALQERFDGDRDCAKIMPRYRSKEIGCAPTIAAGLEVLDRFLRAHDLV